jgi:hypothetical protein
MTQALTLRIILEKPPLAVLYGLQQGSGNRYETIQKQQSDGSDLTFECTVTVKSAKDGSPDFGGPFVQGKPGERFIYIDIGKLAGQEGPAWERRLKVPLRGITTEMVVQERILQTRVPGTGKDGTPTCATVKPFNGWHLIS